MQSIALSLGKARSDRLNVLLFLDYLKELTLTNPDYLLGGAVQPVWGTCTL